MFNNQRGSHTLQPTALVHGAYLRLVDCDHEDFQNRAHFFRVAAMAMRQLLVDYARTRKSEKRGGDRDRVVLADDSSEDDSSATELDLVDLNDALTELAQLDERQAKVVELRFLAGLSPEETAEVLGVARRTVFLDWKMARHWLEERLA